MSSLHLNFKHGGIDEDDTRRTKIRFDVPGQTHDNASLRIYNDMENKYIVYILANDSRQTVIRVTGSFFINRLPLNVEYRENYTLIRHPGDRRLDYRSNGKPGSPHGGKSSLSERYPKLVYYEVLSSKRMALKRQKEIEAMVRRKKIELVESVNSEWLDVSTLLSESEIF